MGSTTARRALYKPSVGEQGWGSLVDANWDTVDDRLLPSWITSADADSASIRAPLVLALTLSEDAPANPSWLSNFGDIKATEWVETTVDPSASDANRNFEGIVSAMLASLGTDQVGGLYGESSILEFDGRRSTGSYQAIVVSGMNAVVETMVTSTGDIYYLLGQQSTVDKDGSGKVERLQGHRAEVNVGGSGAIVQHVYGEMIYVTAFGASVPTIPKLYGIELDVSTTGTVPVTEKAGAHVPNLGASGTADSYALLIEAQSGSTRSWAIKSKGGRIDLALPTVDPHVAGVLWANAGVVTVSAG